MSNPSTEIDDDELPPRKPRIAARCDTRHSGWAAYAQDPEDRFLPSAPDLNKHRHVGYGKPMPESDRTTTMLFRATMSPRWPGSLAVIVRRLCL